MELVTLLGQLGLGLATSSIYDLLKSCAKEEIPAEKLTEEIQNQINLHGISMQAETVISALAEHGFISIKGSQLHANESLIFGSVEGGASVGYDSKLSTDRTAIEAKGNASMETVGNAQVRQNPDGSISFHVGQGKGDSIKFKT